LVKPVKQSINLLISSNNRPLESMQKDTNHTNTNERESKQTVQSQSKGQKIAAQHYTKHSSHSIIVHVEISLKMLHT